MVEHLGLSTASFVGHSFGGREIVRYASRYGLHGIRRAAFLAPNMPDLSVAFTPEQLSANLSALKADVPGWCATNAAPFFGERTVSPGLVDWVSRQIIDTPLPVLLRTMAGFAVDFTDELSAFGVPTLVVHGRDDLAVSAEEGRLLASIIPGAQLVLLPSGTHYFPADREVVAKAAGAIARFLHEPATTS